DPLLTNGLGAEGKPIAGGATIQDGWPVGRAVALRPAGEIQVPPTLVDAQPVRLRTRVRFPPPPPLVRRREGRGTAPRSYFAFLACFFSLLFRVFLSLLAMAPPRSTRTTLPVAGPHVHRQRDLVACLRLLRAVARSHEPGLVGRHDELRAVAERELLQQVRDVRLHRVLADDELPGDLAVR